MCYSISIHLCVIAVKRIIIYHHQPGIYQAAAGDKYDLDYHARVREKSYASVTAPLARAGHRQGVTRD